MESLIKDSIGELLLKAKKISPADIDKIVKLQKEQGLYFGEAVLKLGLAKKEDVDMAIAHQFAYPYLRRDKDTISKEVLAAYLPFSPKVEVIRQIRTTLLLAGAGEKLKSICIAECREGDGRTFLASNLAIVFAQLGHNTLLMDFNLHTPKIHTLFQLKNSCGVSSLLANRATMEEAVQDTPFEKLKVLTSGPIPPNSLELISRGSGKQLMEDLKKTYEVIIINAPSFEKAADISYMASFMDAVLLVVMRKKTRKDDVKQAKRILQDVGANLLGIIFNEK